MIALFIYDLPTPPLLATFFLLLELLTPLHLDNFKEQPLAIGFRSSASSLIPLLVLERFKNFILSRFHDISWTHYTFPPSFHLPAGSIPALEHVSDCHWHS